MCIGDPGWDRPRAERGIALIELIIFIILVSIAVVGVLGALKLGTSASADPMIRKQALAIAEAVLEEVQLMPFTYCDPDDVKAATATSAADCTGSTGGSNDESKLSLGPEACAGDGAQCTAETRTGTTEPYDNVSDYNGYNPPTGITDITGTAVPGLELYDITSITVANQALGAIPASDSLLITVTVAGPPGSNTTVVLHGYRVRYAPNALP